MIGPVGAEADDVAVAGDDVEVGGGADVGVGAGIAVGADFGFAFFGGAAGVSTW